MSYAMHIFQLAAILVVLPTASEYTLYFTDGGDDSQDFTDVGDDFQASSYVHSERRLQDPMPHYWLGTVTYDDKGSILHRVNVTKPQNGMGYISVSPDGGQLLFATERMMPWGWMNVDTFLVDHNNAPYPPNRVLLKDISGLLKAYTNMGCTQVSTFHAVFSPDNKSVVFAYRAWTQLGVAVGSQALAISNADGTNDAHSRMTWSGLTYLTCARHS